jgi:hypothetical protein
MRSKNKGLVVYLDDIRQNRKWPVWFIGTQQSHQGESDIVCDIRPAVQFATDCQMP